MTFHRIVFRYVYQCNDLTRIHSKQLTLQKTSMIHRCPCCLSLLEIYQWLLGDKIIELTILQAKSSFEKFRIDLYLRFDLKHFDCHTYR